MMFVDSNVLMHLVGIDHPRKALALQLLEIEVGMDEAIVTDAEVLQEILRGYVELGRRDAIQPAFDALLGLVDEVLPVEARDVQRAQALVLGRPHLPARAALHLAVLERAKIRRILTFDTAFDDIDIDIAGLIRVREHAE